MKYSFFLGAYFFICLFISCEKSTEDPVLFFPENLIIGTWKAAGMVDTFATYDRVNSLHKDEYGFSFKAEEIFVERKNAGFCGTPPITYADFNGTWSENDSNINITVGYWGGSLKYKWKLISVDRDQLVIDRQEELTTILPD